jgi:hypothetical protein
VYQKEKYVKGKKRDCPCSVCALVEDSIIRFEDIIVRCINYIHFITGVNSLRFAIQKAAFTFVRQCRISIRPVLVSGYDGCPKRRKTTSLLTFIFQISTMSQVQISEFCSTWST